MDHTQGQTAIQFAQRRQYARRGACVEATLSKSADVVSFFHNKMEEPSLSAPFTSAKLSEMSLSRKRTLHFDNYQEHGWKRHVPPAA